MFAILLSIAVQPKYFRWKLHIGAITAYFTRLKARLKKKRLFGKSSNREGLDYILHAPPLHLQLVVLQQLFVSCLSEHLHTHPHLSIPSAAAIATTHTEMSIKRPWESTNDGESSSAGPSWASHSYANAYAGLNVNAPVNPSPLHYSYDPSGHAHGGRARGNSRDDSMMQGDSDEEEDDDEEEDEGKGGDAKKGKKDKGKAKLTRGSRYVHYSEKNRVPEVERSCS